ncbi:hypothetical protein EDB19DRAFT_1914843 [Suillus lakei]|nr:hypothetical protein EDB19DRAFT_1914843 [Suillus lakei]
MPEDEAQNLHAQILKEFPWYDELIDVMGGNPAISLKTVSSHPGVDHAAKYFSISRTAGSSYSNSLGSGSTQFSAQPFSPQLPPAGAQPYSPQLPPSASQPYPSSGPLLLVLSHTLLSFPPQLLSLTCPPALSLTRPLTLNLTRPLALSPTASGTPPTRSRNNPNSLLDDDNDMDFHSKIY